MLKILNKILTFVFFLTLIAIILFVFKVPPFKAETTNQKQPEENDVSEVEKLSPDKIARQKRYEDYMQRGLLLEKSNFPNLAINEYLEASKKFPEKNEPLIAIGKIHLRTSNFEKAEEFFKQLIAKNPQSAEMKILLARAYIGQRKIEDAKKTLDSVSVESTDALYYKALIQAYLGEYEVARKNLNKANSLTSDTTKKNQINNFLNAFNEFNFNTDAPPIHLKTLLSRSFIQCGEYQLAIGQLFEVTKAKNDYRDAWILLGYSYLKIEKYNDSIEALNRALALDPDKAETHFYLGLAKYNLNQYQEAINHLNQARKLNYQPDIQITQKLSEIQLLLNNNEEAVKNYEQILSSINADPNYYIRPIYIYLEKTKEPQKALKLALQAAEKFPKSAMSHNLLAWSLLYNEELERAEKELRIALKINPDLDAIYLNFGILFEKKAEPEKALIFYKKAYSMGNGNGVSAAASNRFNNLLAQNPQISNKLIQANLLQQ